MPATTPAPAGALPRPFLVWLAGVTVGRLGDAVLAFGLGWAAAGHGGTTAALVLTLSGVPRVVLLVLGGAVADRFGARRILIAGEATLLVLAAVLALALARYGTPTWLLLSASLVLGTVTAFSLPASGSMPRRLVPDEQLTRALALRQGAGQTVAMAAAPLGGVVVAAVSLPAVAWGDAAALAVSLGVLVAVRELAAPAADAGAPGTAGRPGLALGDGLRVVARTPGLRRALALTGAGAALVLPVPSLLVPLLGRAEGWGAGTTGAVAGAVGVGAVGAALLIARRRSPAPALTVPRALGACAAGVLLLAGAAATAAPAAATVAVAGALVLGVGQGVFVAKLAPLVLGTAPRTHLARVQALVGLAQIVPVMVTNTLLGALADRASPAAALIATALGLLACAAGARRATPTGPAARGEARVDARDVALDPRAGRGPTVGS